MTSTIAFVREGDKVSVASEKWPGIWTVQSVAKTTVSLQRVSDGARLKASRGLLIEPTEDLFMPEVYEQGSFVRITSGRFAGLWIVTADRGGARVSLATPGGGQRISAGKQGLVKIEPKDVLKPEPFKN